MPHPLRAAPTLSAVAPRNARAVQPKIRRDLMPYQSTGADRRQRRDPMHLKQGMMIRAFQLDAQEWLYHPTGKMRSE